MFDNGLCLKSYKAIGGDLTDLGPGCKKFKDTQISELVNSNLSWK